MSDNRYHRQQVLIGQQGQKRLNDASVLLIGAGGIGSPLALYLAAAGIGKLGIIDDDVVDLSNLQRQILFDMDDIGQSKAIRAQQKLQRLNNEIVIETFPQRFDVNSAHQLIPGYDLMIDGSDNFPTRYCVNDFCALYQKPLISASVHQRQGQVMFYNGQQGCYRCLFPLPPLISFNCATAGVMGLTVGMTAMTAGTMAINYFLTPDSAPMHQLLLIETQPIAIKTFSFEPNSQCQVCAQLNPLKEALNHRYRPIGIAPEEKALKNYQCIDVRESHEDRKKTLSPDDIHLPLTTLAQNLDKLGDKPLLFYCAKGIRSHQTAFIMRDKGYDAYYYCGELR
ncbi:ThiF family adenylyltransferase [Legionella sp. W05-934-2]|uniref:ThiF family adenylyltransferase n=1 Tax=Legionella sp. W05-934-2 TaxID=1198649 RepID=UPI0034627366